MEKFKSKRFELITWLIAALAAILLCVMVLNNIVFPSRFKLSLFVLLAVIVFISGFFSLLTKKLGRYVIGVINIILTLGMIGILFILPKAKEEVSSLFKETDNEEAIINIYALKDNVELSENENPVFIIQGSVDQDNQDYAVDEIEKYMRSSIEMLKKEDILSSVEALYQSEGDCLILNDVYVDAIEELGSYRSFSDDTKVVYSVSKKLDTDKKIYNHENITSSPFTVYAAGCDTRSGRLTIYGRTDVNLLLTVNPNTKQILIVGIPRDAYIPNPALDYGDDKLTHLGNKGIENTMKGVSEYFNIEINHYGEVIFESFKRIIDALGGIDVDNPYYFNTIGKDRNNIEFPEGIIHLDGEDALAYCRERKSLEKGDFDRNEHQTYVLKAVINKILSKEILDKYITVWDSLKGQFMTSFTIDDLLQLTAMQIDDNSKWDIITYHLGGKGDMQGTASMGWNRKLYVVHLFDSLVEFVKGQIDLMMNDERVEQGVLPQNDETTYIPN